MCFDRLPLIANLPPLVLDCSRLTLLDLGRRDFMYSTNLPPAAQARPQPCPTIDLPCPIGPAELDRRGWTAPSSCSLP